MKEKQGNSRSETAKNRNFSVKKNPGETVEFFIPHLGLDLSEYIAIENKQGIHHISRYAWAVKVLKGLRSKNIMDIACGAGYGSYMLATTLPECKILGGDYDKCAVDHALQNYTRSNLSYAIADIVSWTNLETSGSLGAMDVVISFDTIEHLLHREICLINIAEHLSQDGMLLFSTPVKEAPILNPGWEHHKLEYSHSFLKNFLKRFFHKVIIPGDPDFPEMEFWDKTVNGDRQRYLTRTNPIVCRGPIKLGL